MMKYPVLKHKVRIKVNISNLLLLIYYNLLTNCIKYLINCNLCSI